jgi:superoxide dismutase, Fe-Mn family
MAYTLPELPYAYDALEPHYDKETVTLHHDKHHAGYVAGLNAALDKMDAARTSGDMAAIKALSKELAFHGSGHILHSMFWMNMRPNGGGEPSGKLGEQIVKDFGSYAAFKKQFIAATNSVEGSGWGILGWQKDLGRLIVVQAEIHQNLTVQGIVPILVCDVWEHAYYLKFQNRRPDWTTTFMDHLVNWDDVASRFAHAVK